MLNKLINFIYTWIFKPRFLYAYPLDFKINGDEPVKVVQLSDIGDSLQNLKATQRLESYINKRSDNSAWVLFLYITDGAIAGYSFLHAPDNEEWLDSVATQPGQARTCSTFVEPEHRGKRIRGLIMEHQKAYCVKKDLKLWSVIEKTNLASIKSAERQGGYVDRKNYLVKFLKRNVFSILLNPFEIHLLLGSKRASR